MSSFYNFQLIEKRTFLVRYLIEPYLPSSDKVRMGINRESRFVIKIQRLQLFFQKHIGKLFAAIYRELWVGYILSKFSKITDVLL